MPSSEVSSRLGSPRGLIEDQTLLSASLGDLKVFPQLDMRTHMDGCGGSSLPPNGSAVELVLSSFQH